MAFSTVKCQWYLKYYFLCAIACAHLLGQLLLVSPIFYSYKQVPHDWSPPSDLPHLFLANWAQSSGQIQQNVVIPYIPAPGHRHWQARYGAAAVVVTDVSCAALDACSINYYNSIDSSYSIFNPLFLNCEMFLLYGILTKFMLICPS